MSDWLWWLLTIVWWLAIAPAIGVLVIWAMCRKVGEVENECVTSNARATGAKKEARDVTDGAKPTENSNEKTKK